MIWFGSRKRSLDEWAEAIRPELRDLPVPPPSDGLLNRIAASRAAGARVILPDGRVVSSRLRARLVLAAAAAALVILMLPLVRRSSNVPRSTGADVTPSSPSATSEWLPNSTAFAQTEPRGDRPAPPPIRWTQLDRLRPVALSYVRTWRDASERETGRANASVTLDTATLDGVRAWRLVSRTEGTLDGRPLLTVDSVFVTRDALGLLERTAYVQPYSKYDEIKIVQAYRGDSVLGRMNAKGADATAAGRPIARRLGPGAAPYIADALAPVLLGAVTLGPGWKGYAVMIGWAVVDADVKMPVELGVDGDESITVPAGRFDCWRLSIRYRDRRIAFWARKSDGVGVRTRETDPRTGSVREVVLSRDSSK
jgi:hypothetical protein